MEFYNGMIVYDNKKEEKELRKTNGNSKKYIENNIDLSIYKEPNIKEYPSKECLNLFHEDFKIHWENNKCQLPFLFPDNSLWNLNLEYNPNVDFNKYNKNSCRCDGTLIHFNDLMFKNMQYILSNCGLCKEIINDMNKNNIKEILKE